LEQAAQGSGGVPIPEGVQQMCISDTSGLVLAGMVVLCQWLDFKILEVFYSPNDSMIL